MFMKLAGALHAPAAISPPERVVSRLIYMLDQCTQQRKKSTVFRLSYYNGQKYALQQEENRPPNLLTLYMLPDLLGRTRPQRTQARTPPTGLPYT